MPTVTVQVSDELKKQMDSLDDVNWSAVARKSFENKVKLWNILEKVSEKSTMTEEDAVMMGRELKKNAAAYYGWTPQTLRTTMENRKRTKEN